MLQKDYWSMSDSQLAELASKFNIESEGYDDAYQRYFKRDYIIASLVSRDAALRTRGVLAISIGSLVISLAALIISLLKG